MAPSFPTSQSFLRRRFPSDVFPATFVGVIVLGKNSGQFHVVTRFFNEARAANLVQHPAIVRVFDYGTTSTGTAYLAMEFLEGESLRARMMRERTLSEAVTIRIGRQIASGLAAAHASQVIHRDLKPENIFVVPDAEAPSGERAKILDFGIAKLTDNGKGAFRTGTNMLLGTPIYMSPEQCRGAKNVGDRSDVYALGVMLFEMLAGRPPFETEMPGEYIALHIFQPPPALRQFAPQVDERIEQLIASMLTKDPKLRPPMVEVAQRLKFLGNLQSDQLGRGPLERSSEPVPQLPAPPVGKPLPEDATEILPANRPPADWQLMNVIAGKQQTPTSHVPAIKNGAKQPSGERQRESLRQSGYLTPQRRAQIMALLTLCIAICLGVLITLFLVGS